MSENASGVRLGLMALITAGTALWGWFGWLVVVWIGCMVVDYISGSLASIKAKEWNSQRAREGLWHKGGMILIVVVAGIADILIGLLLHMDGMRLPFNYTVLLCPVALAWYTLTELGSIIENAALLGTRVPRWLPRWMKVVADAMESTGDKLVAGTPKEDATSEAGQWTDTESHFPNRQEDGGEDGT